MTMVGFPLLLIPLAIYNIIIFLMPGVSLAEPILKLTLMSGAEWPVSLSDILLALGILLLLFEVIKGARPGAKYLTDHLLSLIVTAAAAAEFLLWSKFGNSTYFLLTLLSGVDFFSGIALRARRGTQLAPAAASRRASKNPASKNPESTNLDFRNLEPAAEPQFDPVPTTAAPGVGPAPVVEPASVVEPARSIPPAAPVADPVLTELPEPKLLPSSPEVPSPGLQPGHTPDTPRR